MGLQHLTIDDKGANNGVASLDGSGKVPLSQLAAKSMVVSFAARTDMSLSTSTVGYVEKANMIYAGSSTVGPIVSIKATIWKNSASGSTGQIKIIDKSNGNTICELTGITNLDDAVVLDLGALTNIPTGPTTFEIQMGRSTGGNRRIECSSIEIEY